MNHKSINAASQTITLPDWGGFEEQCQASSDGIQKSSMAHRLFWMWGFATINTSVYELVSNFSNDREQFLIWRSNSSETMQALSEMGACFHTTNFSWCCFWCFINVPCNRKQPLLQWYCASLTEVEVIVWKVLRCRNFHAHSCPPCSGLGHWEISHSWISVSTVTPVGLRRYSQHQDYF